MKLGLFFDLPPRNGYSQTAAFEEAFQQIQIAEEEGLDSVWIAERHFLPQRSVASAPMILASAIASRTQRLRVGTAVNVLPLTDPVRLAEEIATLDHICRGRFDFGVGRSSGQKAYVGFNVPYTESQARFAEALEVIQMALTQERFSYNGRFYTYDDVCVVPKPYQRPHPPIRMAITSPESFIRAGEMGLPIFMGLIASKAIMAERIEKYRRAWAEAGHEGQGDVCLRLAVHVAPTMDQALQEPKKSAMNFYNNILANENRPIPGLSDEENRRRVERGLHMSNITYQEVLKDHVVFGTPDVVTERLLELKEDLGLSSAIVDVNLGGLVPQDQLDSSLQLLAQQVLPSLK